MALLSAQDPSIRAIPLGQEVLRELGCCESLGGAAPGAAHPIPPRRHSHDATSSMWEPCEYGTSAVNSLPSKDLRVIGIRQTAQSRVNPRFRCWFTPGSHNSLEGEHLAVRGVHLAPRRVSDSIVSVELRNLG